jgi:5-hydroxyisourate hydrolase
MSAITTQILDLSPGAPAEGVDVVLETMDGPERWRHVGRGATDRDGRLRSLQPAESPLQPGCYRLRFATRAYFDRSGVTSFHPYVIVTFDVVAGQTHCHVPLLLSPFGYSTYRGS